MLLPVTTALLALAPGLDAQRSLLKIVATSADSIGALAREGLSEPPPDLLSDQKRAARSLRRSWDARLSWSLRKRAEVEGGASSATESLQSAPKKAAAPTAGTSAQDAVRVPGSDRAAMTTAWMGTSAQDVVRIPASEPVAETTEWMGTVTAVTAATVIQVAEWAAVAVLSSSPTQAKDGAAAQPCTHTPLTRSTGDEMRPWIAAVDGPYYGRNGNGATVQPQEPACDPAGVTAFETAAAVTAATLMQATEMAAVAIIKAVGAEGRGRGS
jgi:hypothetical protein